MAKKLALVTASGLLLSAAFLGLAVTIGGDDIFHDARSFEPMKPLIDVASHKAGNVAWLPAGRDAQENLSDHPVEFVLVELKPGAPEAKGWPVELDPVKLNPAHEQVLFENARVRVLRTILEPHLKGPAHDHPSYVVVYLTELHTTMTLADGNQVDNPRHPGEVAWRDPYRHATENVGDRTAVEIQIELK